MGVLVVGQLTAAQRTRPAYPTAVEGESSRDDWVYLWKGLCSQGKVGAPGRQEIHDLPLPLARSLSPKGDGHARGLMGVASAASLDQGISCQTS